MALPSAVVEEGVNKVFSYISTKLEDKVLTADTIARIEIALSRIDFVLEKTGKIPITYFSSIHTWKGLKRVHMEGMDLLNKYKPQDPDGLEETGKAVVRSSSYLQQIANRAANLSMSSLVGFSKARLSPSVAKTFERYADSAEKFVREVESSCPLWCDTFCFPFLRYLFEGKTLWYIVEKKRSQSVCFYLHPVIVEGRGIEVILFCASGNSRKREECSLLLSLRISEDTDIIGISIKCLQWLTSQFKLVAESAIGELAQLLPNLQDIFHSYVPPLNFVKDKYVHETKSSRPDPICCNSNSCGTLVNQSTNKIPEQVIEIIFSCGISAPNNLRNAPLILKCSFEPHLPSFPPEEIYIEYGGKVEWRNGGVQQLVEIARSDALDYLVHEPEPTDYGLCLFSPHGGACIILSQAKAGPEAKARPDWRVSKRKR